MKKYTCPICDFVHKGDKPPAHCPKCKCVGKKFGVIDEQAYDYIDEILVQMRPEKPKAVIEIAESIENIENIDIGGEADIIEALQLNFTAECTEVGMYLTMARVAEREGFTEIAEAFRRVAFEEALHAARFAELDSAYGNSTKENLTAVAETEYAASDGKQLLAKMAKDATMDEVHDAVHEMARDELRHAKMFEGLLKRYFK